MRILKVLHLVGPNIWANYPVLEAWVDLGAFDTLPSNTLPGFADRLMAWLPSLIEHRCSEGRRGGFFCRLREGTWLGHVLEHITLELQSLAHLPVGYGRTRETSERGVYRVVVECLDHGFGEACLQSSRELILAAIDDRPFDVAGQLRRLRELADQQCLGPSTQAIVSAAKARAIPFVRLSESNLVQLGYGKAQRRIWAAETAMTCALAESIAQDKELTRRLLDAAGVPMPAGRVVKDREDAWAAAQDLGLPVVVKPQDANHGRGVSIRLEERSAVEAAFDIATREGSGVVVERFVSGTQYRVLVVGDRAVAASGGEAEQVVADGLHTVSELVALANQNPERGEDSAQPLTTLVLDEISLELLRRQGLDKNAIPAAGQNILIHYNGDLVVDETERMHPEIAADCVVAAQTVGLDVAGIDLIAEDIGRPLKDQNGAIIEVNASPGLVMHIKPLVGKPRPVGEAIVNHLFAAQETGRVPLVAVSGTNGKSYVVSMIAAMLAAAGRTVGQTASHGLRIGKRLLSAKDCTDATSVRRVLINPFVDAMVFETSESNVLREGLAFDRCDVAVVTNLGSCDHMGEEYVGDRAFMAKAVRAPVDIVPLQGSAVLNGDDPVVAAMAEKCRGRIIFFSRDGQSGLIRDHLGKGGQAVVAENGRIISLHRGQSIPMASLDLLAGEPFAPAPMVAEDVLAAVSAGIALDLPVDAIRQGVGEAAGDFGSSLHREGGKRVVVAPCRNPSALAAWAGAMAQVLPGATRHAVLEVPSDWRPEDAAEMGRLLRESFATACLVGCPGFSPTVENLCRIIDHPGRSQEESLTFAMDRTIGEAAASDCIFVGPTLRSGCDQANLHCSKRNMVRLDREGLAAMAKGQ